MRIVRFAFVSLVIPLIAHAQSGFCSKDSIPDVIRVTLVNCGEQKELFFRRDGDDRKLFPLTPTPTPGVWQQVALGGSVESNVLCSRFCGYPSTCLAGTPHTVKENGKKSCVAEYEFRCEKQDVWTLQVQSSPPVAVDWTRKRPKAGSMEQRGELRETPGKLCDLAPDEEINLKPQLRANSQFSFRDIPVSRAALLQQKKNTRTLGSNDLVQYVVAPEGKRTEPLSDIEKEFLKQDLRELIFAIDPGSK